MSNTWGSLAWGAGNFGDQSNVTQIVTGVGQSIIQNSVDAYPNQGWGSDYWGIENWGESGLNVNVTGNALSLNINQGWGLLNWNSSDISWGGNTFINVAIGQQINVTGLQLNTSLNSVTEVITVDVFLTNTNLLLGTSLGEVDPSPDALVTGQQLNISTGNVTAYNRQGWGRYYWGEEEWGSDGLWEFVDVNNSNLNLSVDSGIREYWGQDSWGSSNTEWGGSYVTETDISVTVEISSVIMTIAEGEVDPGPDANVTGIGMTVSLAVGTVIAGDANTSVTGEQLNISQGTAEGVPNTLASVTGIGLNIAVGTVFAGGTSIIIPTGNGLTIALNSINNQIWTEVNTGTDATWTEIDTAA